MKNTEKNSWTNNNTLLYIILFLLLVAIIGSSAYYFIGREDRDLAANIAYINDTSEVKKDESLTDKTIASKIDGANNKKKRCREKLFLSNELSAKEKNAYKNVLESINDKVLELDEWKLMKIRGEKEKQAIIYQVLKENQRLDRLELKIDPKLTERLVKFCKQEQPNWEKKIFPSEAKEVIKKIDETFTPFYDKFRKELIRKGEAQPIVEEVIKPKVINGEITTVANLQKHIDFLRVQSYPIKNEKTEEEKFNKAGPLEFKFLGFTDFLEKGEEDEGTVTLGVTQNYGKAKFKPKQGEENQFFVWTSPAKAEIKLKKELLFSRLGENYDRWISNLREKKTGPTYDYSDISWETLIETIAHELAHAVIDSVKWEYESSDGKGHGPLHSDYTKRIREMIEASPEYEKFDKWWKEKW